MMSRLQIADRPYAGHMQKHMGSGRMGSCEGWTLRAGMELTLVARGCAGSLWGMELADRKAGRRSAESKSTEEYQADVVLASHKMHVVLCCCIVELRLARPWWNEEGPAKTNMFQAASKSKCRLLRSSASLQPVVSAASLSSLSFK